MPLVVDDILEIKFLSTLYGQSLMTVLHYAVGSAPINAPTTTQLKDIADTIVAQTDLGALLTVFTNAQVPAVQYTAVTAQRIYPSRSPYVTSLTTIVGAYATGGTTANICATVEKRTDLGGRMGVGSVHIGGIPTAVCANGELTLLYQTSFLDAIGVGITSIFNGAVYSGAYVPALYNPTISEPQKYSVLTGYQSKSEVRTMHRRTVRLGI